MMPHVTFIYPCVGRFPGTRYVRSWQMQPLAIAVLAGLTPPHWGRRLFDDRLEDIEYAAPTELAAISIETYTARRGYQIADEYRRRGVRVVLGGYHATFRPDEALEHADAVCVGEAEPVWERILADSESGRLAGIYRGEFKPDLGGMVVDRSIFHGKPYFHLAMVETGRGCRFACSFCSISAFHGATRRNRPVGDVVADVRSLNDRFVFFVDDNVAADTVAARELFKALVPLRTRWIGQCSIHVAKDSDLLDLMALSGCTGLLIGFESMNQVALSAVGKKVNITVDYAHAISELRRRGIAVYGTFVYGLPGERLEDRENILRFAGEQKLFMAAFAHVMPFPGTPLYDEIERAGRLLWPKWWLSEAYRFGQVPFRPDHESAADLEEACHSARTRFYSVSSILHRAMDLRTNCAGPFIAVAFWLINGMLRREIGLKRGLPLGAQEVAHER